MEIRYPLFFRCIAYNTAESLIYHTLLLGHQLMLFKLTTYAQYGSFGSLFALIYLLVTIANLGLDASLGTFFYEWSQSKQQFLRFIVTSLLPNILILTVFFIGLLVARPSLSIIVANAGCNETVLLLIAAGIIISESIKKTIKLLLQIVLKVRTTALAEIGTILIYTASVWGFYLMGFPINGYLIFIPLLVVSMLSSIFLLRAGYKWYRSLADKAESIETLPYSRIIKNRAFTYANEMSNALFSSNFLIPFFALHFDLSTAGALKLTSNVLHSVTTVLHKIFGTSSTVLLATLKKKSLHTKKHAFSLITQSLYQVLYSIAIFFIINGNKLLASQSSLPAQISFIIVLLYFVMSFVENFAIAYEKFLIIQERADYLCIINVLSIMCIASVLHSAHNLSLLTILLLITGIRIASLLAISAVSFYLWRILPAWRMRPNYLIASMLFALLFFFIVR